MITRGHSMTQECHEATPLVVLRSRVGLENWIAGAYPHGLAGRDDAQVRRVVALMDEHGRGLEQEALLIGVGIAPEQALSGR